MKIFTSILSIFILVFITGCEEDRRGTGGGTPDPNANDTTSNGTGNNLNLKTEIVDVWDITRFDMENMKVYTDGVLYLNGTHKATDIQSTFEFKSGTTVEVILSHTDISTYTQQGFNWGDTVEVNNHFTGTYEVLSNSRLKLDPTGSGDHMDMDVINFTKNKIQLYGQFVDSIDVGNWIEYEHFIDLER